MWKATTWPAMLECHSLDILLEGLVRKKCVGFPVASNRARGAMPAADSRKGGRCI